MTEGDKLVKAIRDLATAYPHAIYEQVGPDDDSRCSYEYGNVKFGPSEEGCIVGQALRNIGYFVGDDVSLTADRVIGELLLEEVTENQAAWANIVQEKQDQDWEWSDAVAEADRQILI